MDTRPPSPAFPNVSLRMLVLFCAAFYLAWIVRVVVFMPIVDASSSPWERQTLGTLLRALIWGLPVWFMLARVHHARVISALALDCMPRGRRLVETMSIMIGWLTVTSLFGVFVEHKSHSLTGGYSFSRWGMIALTIAWAPFFEEVLSRGYVHQALRNHFQWPAASCISAVLFAAAHWPGWIYMQGLHTGLIAQTVSIVIIGLVLAVVFERGKSLWLCILLHTLNNLLWAG